MSAGIAARLAPGEQVGQQRRRDPSVDRVAAGGQAVDAGAAGGAVADAGIAAHDADIAGDRRQRIGGAVELLAVRRAARGVAALQGRGLGRGELDRELADGLGRDAAALGGPFGSLRDAVALAQQVGFVGGARGRAFRQMRLVEAQHMAVAEGLVVQALAHDHLGHGDQGGGVGRRFYEDVLVGQRLAGAGAPGIDADDAHTLLLGLLQVLEGAGAEGAVGRAPAPHQDELRVDVVGGLAAGALVVGLGAEGHAHGEDLGLGRHVGPQERAAAELVEEAFRDAEAVQGRGVARARGVEEGGVAVSLADAAHLARDMVEGRVPGDALELARTARAGAAHGVPQAVLVIEPLDLADAAGAGMQRRQLGLPARRIGRDFYDAIVDHVGVDHAAAAAIVAAGAGDDGFALAAGGARLLVDRVGHGGSVASPRRPANGRPFGGGRMICCHDPAVIPSAARDLSSALKAPRFARGDSRTRLDDEDGPREGPVLTSP